MDWFTAVVDARVSHTGGWGDDLLAGSHTMTGPLGVADDERSQGEADGERAGDSCLWAALRGLAALVTAEQSMNELLVEVAGWAMQAIPGADGAAVTLRRYADGNPEVPSWTAVTADFVREIHLLQREILREGPHWTCLQTQTPVVSGSLGIDRRWLRFGPRVAALGVSSAAAWPLLVGEQVIGVIDGFARDRDAFDEHAVHLGAQFAGPAAVLAYNARELSRAQEFAKQLQHALHNRAVIDQAIGIIRGRTGASAEEALARLVHISQTDKVDLSATAHRLVEHSVRRSRMLRP